MPAVGHAVSVVVILIAVTKFSGLLVGQLASPVPRKVEPIETNVTEVSFTVDETAATVESGSERSSKPARTERIISEVYDNDRIDYPRGTLIGYLERLIIVCLVYGQTLRALI